MSFDSFLEKISDNNKTRNFIIDISDFTSELTEDDYKSLLEFIKEKYSSDIVLNENQQIHYNECVLKETIIKEMEKNKAFEIALNKKYYPQPEFGFDLALDLREFPEELTEYHFKRLLEYRSFFMLEELVLNDQQKIQFNKSKFKDEINAELDLHKAQNHGEPWMPERAIKPEKTQIYIPRKGMVWLPMIDGNLIDEKGEYALFSRQKALEQNPKLFLFNLNNKPKTIKKKIQNQEKLFIDNQFSRLVDASLIEDYYDLKQYQRINFKK